MGELPGVAEEGRPPLTEAFAGSRERGQLAADPSPESQRPEQKRWDAVSGVPDIQRRSDVPTAGPSPESRADPNAALRLRVARRRRRSSRVQVFAPGSARFGTGCQYGLCKRVYARGDADADALRRGILRAASSLGRRLNESRVQILIGIDSD